MTIMAILKVMASSNLRISSPIIFSRRSKRYTSVFRWMYSCLAVSEIFRLFSKISGLSPSFHHLNQYSAHQNLFDKHFAKAHRKLVNQSADAKLSVGNGFFFYIKDSSYFQCHLGFLIRFGNILQGIYRITITHTDTHHRFCMQIVYNCFARCNASSSVFKSVASLIRIMFCSSNSVTKSRLRSAKRFFTISTITESFLPSTSMT